VKALKKNPCKALQLEGKFFRGAFLLIPYPDPMGHRIVQEIKSRKLKLNETIRFLKFSAETWYLIVLSYYISDQETLSRGSCGKL